jgi:hypothetical protein
MGESDESTMRKGQVINIAHRKVIQPGLSRCLCLTKGGTKACQGLCNGNRSGLRAALKGFTPVALVEM